MVFSIVTDGGADEISLPECDAAVLGFGALGEVDYEKELKGETEKFEKVARLSKSGGCALICGCRTLSRGTLRKSAAVADCGKLLGISDMVHVLDGEDFKSGSALGLYKVGGCKIGLCIDNDVMFPDTFKSLAMCGCSAAVVLLEEIKDNIPPLLIRAYSYLYGIPVVMVAGKTAYFADTTGAIASSTQKVTVFEVIFQNRYRLVTTRAKGITCEPRADY